MKIEIKDKLNVFWNEKQVGELFKASRKGKIRYLFKYSNNWNGPALSLSLPIPEDKEELLRAENFFKFLTFEEKHGQIIRMRLGIEQSDFFTLLKYFGRDCAGALQILPVDANYEKENQTILRDVTQKVKDHISGKAAFKNPDYIQTPNLILDCNARLSLAGNQEKLPCVYKNNKIYVPDQGYSTHILKVPSESIQFLPENEYICMQLAKAVGFNVPKSQLIYLEGKWNYIVQRYDRNKLGRIHQEDMAQALNLNKKYQEDGGPSLSDCIHVIETYHLSAEEKENFIKMVLYNYCIGNTDAHGRNFSILIPYADKPVLAPFYDLVCPVLYSKFSKRMAMSIGDTYNIDDVRDISWEIFAKRNNISLDLLQEYKENLTAKILETLPQILDLFLQQTNNIDFSRHINNAITHYTLKLQELDFSYSHKLSF